MKNNKANNLREGAIYFNNHTGTLGRLVNIIPCQGVWLEAYDGQGYGEHVAFNDVHYTDKDGVEDYLADLRVYNGSKKAPAYKEQTYKEDFDYDL